MEKILISDLVKWTNSNFNTSKIKDEYIINISKDSRTINNNDLYIALKGENFDGHEFIDAAFKNGASYAICSEDYTNISKENIDKCIYVKDTMEALSMIANNYLKMLNIPVIAITGSVGKTTSKEMIASILKTERKVLKTFENLNNTVGVPFTVFELDKTYDLALIEGGMNHFGELEFISKTLEPDICVITNIGESHIGNLGSKDGILKAKSEIFSHMKLNGKLYINGNDTYLNKIKETNKDINIISCGFNNSNNATTALDYYITNSNLGNDETVTYETNIGLTFKINSLVSNLASAAILGVAIAKDLGFKDESIIEGIKSFVNVGKRSEIIKLKNITMLKDCYNSSPISVLSAMQTLCNIKTEGTNLVTILGDINELGDFAKDMHSELGSELLKYDIRLAIFIGENMINGFNAYTKGDKLYFKTKEEFIDSDISKVLQENDIILVKASNSHKFSVICDEIEKLYK